MRKDPHIANIFSAEEEDCLSLEQMTAYQQGKLAGQDKNLVERHLLNCELCAITLESIAENGVEAIETGAAEVADLAWDRVQQRQNRKRRGAIFWIASAASIALLVTVGYFTMRQPTDDDYAQAFGNAIQNTPPMAVDGLKERDYAMAESPDGETGVESAKEAAPDEQLLAETKEVQPVAPTKTTLQSTSPSMAKDLPNGMASSGKDAIKGGSDLSRNDNMGMREPQLLGGASGKSVSKAPVSDYQIPTMAKPSAMPAPTPMAPKTTSTEDGDQSYAGNDEFDDAELYNDALSVTQAEYESKSVKKEAKRDRESAEDIALEDQVSGRAVSAANDKRLITAASKAPGSNKARSATSKEKAALMSPSKAAVSEQTMADPSPVDRSYEQGILSYKEGNFREAARELRKATELTPSNLDAHIFAADAFLRTSQPQAALFHIERVLAVPGNSHLEEAEWFKALAYLQLKDDANTKPQLQKVIDGGGKFKGLAEKALAELK